jgi:undecaprenyl-phosphate galactose phosphotransferase
MTYRKQHLILILLLLMLDLITVSLGLFFSVQFRDFLGQSLIEPMLPSLQWFFSFYPIFSVLFIISLWSQVLYKTQLNSWQDGSSLLKACLLWLANIGFYLGLTKQMQDFSRLVWIGTGFFTFFLSWVIRFFVYPWIRLHLKLLPRYLIVHSHSPDKQNDSWIPPEVTKACVTQITVNLQDSLDLIKNYLLSTIKHHQIEAIYWNLQKSLSESAYKTYQRVISELSLVIPHQMASAEPNHSLSFRQEYFIYPDKLKVLVGISNGLMSNTQSLVKRTIDITLSAILLILSLPIFLLVSIGIWVQSPGPVIYTHRRIGRNGKTIPVFKFRSMYPDSAQRLEEILKKNPQAAKEWGEKQKITNDPRIFPFGHFIRKTSIDELPQLINVLLGHMSLVGPRPVTQQELENFYKEYRYFYEHVRPGITGLWQISGRSDTTYEQRIHLDTWYVTHWSLWNDLIILLKTIRVVIKREGAR